MPFTQPCGLCPPQQAPSTAPHSSPQGKSVATRALLRTRLYAQKGRCRLIARNPPSFLGGEGVRGCLSHWMSPHPLPPRRPLIGQRVFQESLKKASGAQRRQQCQAECRRDLLAGTKGGIWADSRGGSCSRDPVEVAPLQGDSLGSSQALLRRGYGTEPLGCCCWLVLGWDPSIALCPAR